jgi:hypothetical protein
MGKKKQIIIIEKKKKNLKLEIIYFGIVKTID